MKNLGLERLLRIRSQLMNNEPIDVPKEKKLMAVDLLITGATAVDETVAAWEAANTHMEEGA